MNVPVWSYWIGRKPPWIELCLETLTRNVPDIRILDADAFRSMYRGEVPWDTIALQRPNVQSDFVRAHLLHTIGGVWVDADCIAFRDVRPLYDHLEHADFVAYRKGRFCSAIIAGNPDSKIGKTYYDLMTNHLTANPDRQLGRNRLGPRLIGIARRANMDMPIHLIPPEIVHQVHPHGFGVAPRLQLPVGTWEPPDDAYTCMLTHRALGHMRSWSRQKLLESDTVAGACFRRALGMEAVG
jgi:hypothetical protein